MVSRGLYIGRFQPFHRGHLWALKWILGREDEAIVGIGSAQYSHNLHNPFTLGERVEMIWRTIKSEGLTDRVIVVGIPDTNGQHSIWVSLVLSFVPRFDRVYTNDPLSRRLFKEQGLRVVPIPFHRRALYEATRVRRLMAEGGEWEQLVPPQVAEVIREMGGVERLRELFGNNSTQRRY